MVEGESVSFLEPSEGGGGVGGVVEIALAGGEDGALRVFVREAGGPLGEEAGGGGGLVRVLGVEGGVVVILCGAGDEIAEDGGAVGGEGKFFFKADGRGGWERVEGGEDDEKNREPRGGMAVGVGEGHRKGERS